MCPLLLSHQSGYVEPIKKIWFNLILLSPDIGLSGRCSHVFIIRGSELPKLLCCISYFFISFCEMWGTTMDLLVYVHGEKKVNVLDSCLRSFGHVHFRRSHVCLHYSSMLFFRSRFLTREVACSLPHQLAQ